MKFISFLLRKYFFPSFSPHTKQLSQPREIKHATPVLEPNKCANVHFILLPAQGPPPMQHVSLQRPAQLSLPPPVRHVIQLTTTEIERLSNCVRTINDHVQNRNPSYKPGTIASMQHGICCITAIKILRGFRALPTPRDAYLYSNLCSLDMDLVQRGWRLLGINWPCRNNCLTRIRAYRWIETQKKKEKDGRLDTAFKQALESLGVLWTHPRTNKKF